MFSKKSFSFLLGFTILFAIYHFPEFYSQFWIAAAGKIGFIIVAFIIARLQGWKGLGGYGLGIRKGWLRELWGGVMLGLVFFSLSVFLSVQFGFEKISFEESFNVVARRLPMLLLMTAVPSIAEDILTRGYLFGHLRKMKPFYWILLSSGVYVLNHIWRLQEGAAVLSYLFLLGLVLALCVRASRALWLAFGIHWGANIAFESSHSFARTSSLVTHEGSTWLLAGAWALLLFLLLLQYRKTNSHQPAEKRHAG